MEQQELLSTKEVAERLGLTVTTIYQYVKNKKLVPVYEDWTVDETMLFYESDVEKLENQRPTGYTTSEVAKKLGVHQVIAVE
ncbi:helix-turn-helix domain-containing protein [Oceanobacillus piezotolerans]|uniref:helix-turn-helix domain-containing protein n=1 Tax=Oceanobacillus piezotolerans TaxID=2448030 RepID=UPI0013144F31|nr:helix-turn-helix domain-containing protein [Oceanobacillus piezotolerans]